jgi:hypothetical protein
MNNRNKAIPRPFNFKEIGKGDIVEEAAKDYDTWAPSIQVLKFKNGRIMVRFCYYTKTGKIAPRALSLNEDDISNLRKEIKEKPQVRKFLQRLLSDEAENALKE